MSSSLFQSPLRRHHRRTSRFWHRSVDGVRHTHSRILFGNRGWMWPAIALQTTQDLGNCRHALSQMVVAGTMTIYPPILMKPSDDGANTQQQAPGA